MFQLPIYFYNILLKCHIFLVLLIGGGVITWTLTWTDLSCPGIYCEATAFNKAGCSLGWCIWVIAVGIAILVMLIIYLCIVTRKCAVLVKPSKSRLCNEDLSLSLFTSIILITAKDIFN